MRHMSSQQAILAVSHFHLAPTGLRKRRQLPHCQTCGSERSAATAVVRAYDLSLVRSSWFFLHFLAGRCAPTPPQSCAWPGNSFARGPARVCKLQTCCPDACNLLLSRHAFVFIRHMWLESDP